ncbi:hypothetical protein cyc_07296 [Cyclospora cayetanensis]|uniref:Uncharacterized protein n=1 Tax=Cyclospora cayetanensis TaxID=88456 RepID=A0A1D3CW51_9EIME|nr:hypothetical protein cyc_07296 [Cyclospora cayetanensis]
MQQLGCCFAAVEKLLLLRLSGGFSETWGGGRHAICQQQLLFCLDAALEEKAVQPLAGVVDTELLESIRPGELMLRQREERKTSQEDLPPTVH